MARCINNYRLPIKRGHIKEWSKKSSPAHIGKLKHSLDFGCDEGTLIVAALGGIVVWVKNNSQIGGPNKKYWNDGNRIVIKHSNGEYTAYEHLKYRGARVRVGQKVKKRQPIGFSGNTGYSFGPHLHFEVFNKPDDVESEGTTLLVSFQELRRK